MFAGDRLDHLAREIEPNMALGRDVISDRYMMSSFAYQGRGDEFEWVKEINKYALIPDLTVFLSVPVDECIRRIKARKGPGEYYERRHLLEEIDRAYRRHINGEEAVCGAVVTIDGTASEDAVEKAIAEQVKKHLNIK
jgi:dTMP kinase